MRLSGTILSISASAWTLIIGLSSAAAVDLFPGDILVLHGVNNQGELVVVDPVTAGQTLVTADNAFINATDIAIGPGGEIYVTDANNQQVYEVDPATGGLTALVASPFRATALTVTPTGRIFVTKDALSGTIDDNIVFELDPVTGLTTDITHGGFIGAPNGIVFDGTDLPVLDQGGGAADQLVRVDIGTGGQTLIAEGDGLEESTGIALEADGNVVVTNQSTGGAGYDNTLVRIDPTNGNQSLVTPEDSFSQATDVAVASDGSLLVTANAPLGGVNLASVDPVTGVITPVADDGFITNPDAVAAFGTGASILACDGFDAPFDSGPVAVTTNGVLLVRVNLLDGDGIEVGNTLLSRPVLEVDFAPGSPGGPPTDVTGNLLPNGVLLNYPVLSRNQFFFAAGSGQWLQALPVGRYSAPGTYTLRVRSGDAGEYVLGSPCTATYVVE